MVGKPWHPHEDKTLTELAQIKTMAELGTILGRSKCSVHGRIKRLNIDCAKRGEAHWNAKTSALTAAMIQALHDAGFRPIEIHTMLTTAIEIPKDRVISICTDDTWKNLSKYRQTSHEG